MNASVVDKKVAILATDGFEQSELESPLEALKASGPCRKSSLSKLGKSKPPFTAKKEISSMLIWSLIKRTLRISTH
jgi:hypothetical protein